MGEVTIESKVGQVDLTGTNYGKIGLMLGLTIEVNESEWHQISRQKQCLGCNYNASRWIFRSKKHFNWNLLYLQFYMKLTGLKLVTRGHE